MFEASVRDEMAEDMMVAEARPIRAAAPAGLLGRMDKSRSAVSTETMAASVESAATGAALGELFQYNVGVPVTVGRGQSAMVPIVSSKLGPKKDLIYNGSKMPTHPVATLRFKNSTGLTLERGPVTVLENGEYVGEAVLPFTADKGEAVISYAVELGVHIKEEVKTENQLHALQIKGNYLLQQVYNVRHTLYRVDNRTPQPKTILIERSVGAHAVFDTPEPVEKTLDSHRYKVEASPGQVTEFTVKERFLRVQREEIRKQSYQGLQKFLEDKFLDQHTYEGLKALLDTWGEISALEGAIVEQEQRRNSIYKAQEQIQKNMSALAKEGEEGRLRGRYVKQLTEREEELAEIDRIVAATRAEIEKKQAQIEKWIAALSE